MKNKEKFAKEITEQAIQGHHFAFDKQSKRVVACNSIRCVDCLFHGVSSCSQKILEWANAEYKEPKQFTEREKEFIKLFPEIKYIVRNNFGNLDAFSEKPKMFNDCENVWYYTEDNQKTCIIDIWGLDFNGIKKGEEPTSREEILGQEKRRRLSRL